MTQLEEQKPKYQQIVDSLNHAIRHNHLAPGDRLPSDDELAEQYGASRNTAIRALCELRDAGLVSRVKGAGTFVAEATVRPKRFHFIADALFDAASRDHVFNQLQKHIDRQLRFGEKGSLGIDRDMGGTLAQHRQHSVQKAIDEQVDGVFYLPSERSEDAPDLNRQLLDQLAAANIPVVLLDQDYTPYPQRSGRDLVALDNLDAGFRIGQHLIEAGARTILMIVTAPIPETVDHRIKGLQASVEQFGQGEVQFNVYYAQTENTDQLREVLEQHDADAVVGKDDRLAAAAMRVLYAMNRRVPDRVMLAGFDDAAIAAELAVPLTSYRQPVEEMATMAVHLMETRIASPKRPSRHLTVTGQLVERASTCGQPAGSNHP
jgi:DNA-binding LacI/PurR family transcriptional regulator